MNLNEKMKAMLDRRAKEAASLNKDIVSFVKGVLDDERVESLIVNQIENGKSEFGIDFSVNDKGRVWCAGSQYNTRQEIASEKAHEFTINISKEVAKIIKKHGFLIIGSPINRCVDHAWHGYVYFKCKEE